MKNQYRIRFRPFLGLAKLLLISLFWTGCEKDAEPKQLDLEGEYHGYFERNGKYSEVELHFKSGSFEGNSDTYRFPAICKGNYQLNGNSLEFENHCFWTADFDWSLILDDTWKVKMDGLILHLQKANGDRYLLQKI